MRKPLIFAMALALCAPVYAHAQSPADRPAQSREDAQQKQPPSQTPDQQKGVDEYLKSKSGQGGKQEPSASTDEAKRPSDDPVFLNGALNVPGAPKDTQTVPAKFSARNDAIDKTPILAMPIGLSDEQKRKILATIRASNAPVDNVATAKVTSALPSSVTMIELPAQIAAEIPSAKGLKFVRLEDRVLIVSPSNWIVVGEIKN